MLQNKPSWSTLKKLSQNKSLKNLRELFTDKNRTHDLCFNQQDIYLDLSKNWIDKQVIQQLCKLAEESKLKQKIDDLFNSKVVNITENQTASHTNVRNHQHQDYQDSLAQMSLLADKINSGHYKSGFGKNIKQLVNIGIGGSYLGPRLVIETLTNLQSESRIPVYFVASVDDCLIKQLFQSIDVEHSLFCISSKSFSTIETLNNAKAIAAKLQSLKDYKPSKNHSSLMAITANPIKTRKLNIPDSHILKFNNSIGGRFSLWSSIGFPIIMSVGQPAFEQLLKGAESMDHHFQQQSFDSNLPVLMALVSIWYRNFMGLSAYSSLPYDARLRCFPKWLQQLMMESTGKMHNVEGQQLTYPTSPWVFGDHGQLSQHAFFQAFHQGNDILPIDFIGVLEPQSSSQQFLLVNMIAQGAALMSGNKTNNPLNKCTGNRPSTTILLKQMNPQAIGQLLAMYEHMVYTQSVLWDINCFDQPGVELGKQIANDINTHIHNGTLNSMNLDSSTQTLINKIQND